jgi:hypothetical protein
VYRHIFLELEGTDVIKRRRSFAKQLLVAIDGTEYFSSKAIHCQNCSHRQLSNGKTNYFHSVLTPVIVQPGNETVISLNRSSLCRRMGMKNRIVRSKRPNAGSKSGGTSMPSAASPSWATICSAESRFCRALKDKGLHFMLVCKPDSHPQLYQTVAFLAANGVLGRKVVRRWVGKYAEIATYRFANKLPLTGEADALGVNWCEVTLTREDTGEQLYKNAFATDFEVTDTTVEAIVRDGRARWKVENENNNVLKTKGYHLEHNFGHGDQHLASLLLSLNLLAFLFHTVLDLVDEQYQAIRQTLGTRRRFFQDLEALLRYFQFGNWDEVLDFMFKGLELDTG